ncbi:MFS transporter [Schlegelella sp. S2-27]|uniref:MFS transporter n=1 Tax=Caldimonas mangrovi TaxID=2944811 RepID=A0ABT0YLY7_9BURK|nr:MFS transporter [Caldimonas mangrovi]MCM5679747.1 MFS transporter [Caldimonas mangrovi]
MSTTATSPPCAAPEPASPAWALAGLSLSMLLPSLGISIANVALPTLSTAFGASFSEVQWIVLAYLLANTTLVVSAGRLGDVVGHRRLLAAGAALFALASVVCAVAPVLWLLIAARAVQGAAAAVMMALTMALVGQTVPKARTGRAMRWLGTMSAVGTALGPSLGGLLIARFGWPAIFLINLPLGLLAALLVLRHLPAERAAAGPDRPGFDGTGTLLLAATLGAYALAMTTGRSSFGPVNLALLVVAVAGTGLFVWVERRAASPLIRLGVFRDRALGASLASGLLVSAVVMATLVVGPFHLSGALRLDAMQVGIFMSMGPAVSALTGALAGRLVDRFGASRMATGGLAGMAAGCLALFALPVTLGVVGYVMPIMGVTASYALFQAANNTAVMAEVPQAQRGLISGLLTLARNLGLVTGASAMGAVFAHACGTADVSTAQPAAVAAGMQLTFAVAAALMLVALAMSAAGRR